MVGKFPSAGVAVRVVNMAKSLPYEVNVVLPQSDSPPHPRLKGPQLDVVIPSDSTRHFKLGLFMDSWSRLENVIVLVLARLLDGPRTARIIATRTGVNALIEIMNDLATLKLEPEDAATLKSYTERLGRLNTKRNVLVHGCWMWEAAILHRGNEAVMTGQFLREAFPTDPALAEVWAIPKNQKLRVRYSFTFTRIDGATNAVDELASQLGAFRTQMKLLAP